jgi:hypothetical protein
MLVVEMPGGALRIAQLTARGHLPSVTRPYAERLNGQTRCPITTDQLVALIFPPQ